MAALRLRQRPATDQTALEARADADAPRTGTLAVWVALAALASVQLVAVTNHLTQNVPSMPMMWVLPLVIYLITFVLCFDNDRWYRPARYASALVVSVAAMAWALLDRGVAHDLATQSLVFGLALFACCMFCHGELAASRPVAAQLSRFYLCVAIGSAVGGALVALAAPLLLPANFEVEIGMVLTAAVLWWRRRRRGALWATAADLGLHALYLNDPDRKDEPLHASSDRILLSKSRTVLGRPALRDHAGELPQADARHVWTDAFSNVTRVIRTDRLFAF